MALPYRKRREETDYGNLGSTYTQIGGGHLENSSPYDYIIYKSGALTKALNILTGTINSANTHADIPLQACIDALLNGCHIYMKQGSYSIYAPVESDNKSVCIDGPAGPGRGVNPAVNPIVQLKATATLGANYIFDFGMDGFNSWGSTLRNLSFYGAERTDTLGAINWANQFLGKLDNIFISNFYNTATPARGIYLSSKGAYNCNFNDLFRIHIWDTKYGIELGDLSNCNNIYSGRLQNGRHVGAKGIYVNGCDTLQVGNLELISFDEAGSIALDIAAGGGIHRFFGTRFEANATNININAGHCKFFGCSMGTPTVANVVDSSTPKAKFRDCFNYYNTQLCLQGNNAAFTPAVSTLYYYGNAHNVWNTAAGYGKIICGVQGYIRRVDLTFMATNIPTQETFNIYLRKNNASDTTLFTATQLANSYWTELTVDTEIACAVGDFFEVKLTTPAWATPPASVKAMVYLWIDC